MSLPLKLFALALAVFAGSIYGAWIVRFFAVRVNISVSTLWLILIWTAFPFVAVFALGLLWLWQWGFRKDDILYKYGTLCRDLIRVDQWAGRGGLEARKSLIRTVALWHEEAKRLGLPVKQYWKAMKAIQKRPKLSQTDMDELSALGRAAALSVFRNPAQVQVLAPLIVANRWRLFWQRAREWLSPLFASVVGAVIGAVIS